MAKDVATIEGGPATGPAEKDEGFYASFKKQEAQFQAALPPHMPVDRFMRVVLTAVNGNPELLQADRRSLFEAAMKAAQDGLLPDGRDGALVIYNTKLPKDQSRTGKDEWIKKVQWMPMIAGILKRVRNSGELKTIVARVVYGGDKYRCWVDDDGEHVEFEAVEDHDRNIVRRVFAMAKLKDDSVEVEELFPADVEKIRAASKSSGGPAWSNWWSEMAKKSALRRLSKRLPISADLDDLIRRDDDLYDFSNKAGDLPPGFDAVKHPLRDNAQGKPAVTDQSGQAFDAGAGDRREAVIVDREPQGEAEARAESMEAIRRGEHGPREGGEAVRGASQELADQDAGPGKNRGADDRISTGRQSAGKPSEAGSAGAAQNDARPQEAAQRAAAALDQRPYEMTAPSYMGFMRDEFDKATVGAIVDDLWGATRNDRRELLDNAQLVELEADKKAKIASLKLAKGGA